MRFSKRFFAAVLATAFSVTSVPAWALPSGYTVEAGNASFDTSDPNALVITASDRAIINFDSFSIGAGETVRFVQPIDSASVLGRVTGGLQSDIWGSLFSNGEFLLVNPAGIHVHQGAVIEAGSFAASTLAMENASYLAGDYVFEGIGGAVRNDGTISARDGGYVALLGGAVKNTGTLTARLGTVALGAGEKQTLAFSGAGVKLVVDRGLAEKLNAEAPVTNEGTIAADGGTVQLTAKMLNDTFDLMINNEGLVQAGRAVERDGKIELTTNGSLRNVGTLDATEGDLIVRAEGDVVSLGTLRAGFFDEFGATFRLGGNYFAAESSILNKDGAVNISTGNYAGDIFDLGDIIFDSGAVITLTADANFFSDHPGGDGTGALIFSGAGTTFDGQGFNLRLCSNDPVTLNATFTNVNNLTFLTALGTVGTPESFTLTSDVAANGFIQVSSGLLINTAGFDMRAGGNFVISTGAKVNLTGSSELHADFNADGTGAFLMNTGGVQGDGMIVGNGNDVILGTGQAATLRGITGTGNLTLTSSTGSQTYTANAAISTTTLTLSTANSNLFLSGQSLTATTLINNGTLALNGNETVTIGTFDTDSGLVDYAGGAAYVGLAAGNAYNNVRFSGSGSWQMGAAADVNGNLSITGGTLNSNGQGITVAGDWTNSATYTSGASVVTFDGAGAQAVNGGASSFAGLSHTGVGTLTVTSNPLTVTGSLSNAAGTLALAGQGLTASGATFSNAGNVSLFGSETITGLVQDTDSGTFTYVGDGDGSAESFTVKDFGVTDYFNLTFNDPNATKDTFAAGAGMSVAGTLTLTLGTYNANANATTVAGAASLVGGTYLASTATQTFNGGLSVSGATFTGSTGGVDVNGIFAMSSGTFTAPASGASFTVSDDFNVSGGTFTHNSGTVTLDSSTNATVNAPLVGLTFNSLVSSTSGKTIQFTSGDTFNAANFTMSGVSGTPIVLTSTGGGAWTVNPTTATVSFATVTNSNNTSGTTITATNSTNVSGNTNWNFPTPPPGTLDPVMAQIGMSEVRRLQSSNPNAATDLLAGTEDDDQDLVTGADALAFSSAPGGGSSFEARGAMMSGGRVELR